MQPDTFFFKKKKSQQKRAKCTPLHFFFWHALQITSRIGCDTLLLQFAFYPPTHSPTTQHMATSVLEGGNEPEHEVAHLTTREQKREPPDMKPEATPCPSLFAPLRTASWRSLCGRFIVGRTRWSKQCWYDVQASASSSGSSLVNSKRRSKPYPVVLGKSRGRDRTILPNVSNANENSMASEQGPVLAGLWRSVCVLVVFGTCCVTVCFSLTSPFQSAIGSECDGDPRGFKSLCLQMAYRTTRLDGPTPVAVTKTCAVP